MLVIDVTVKLFLGRPAVRGVLAEPLHTLPRVAVSLFVLGESS